MKAKAKAVGRRLARPAAAPRGLVRQRIRRPAGVDEADMTVAWDRGDMFPLHRLSLDLLRPGTLLVSEEAEYFGAKVKFAAMIQRMEIEMDEKYLVVKPLGTDAESVLRVYTADPSAPFRVHVCQAHCDKAEMGDRLVHVHRGRKGQLDGEAPWVRSLEGVAPPPAPRQAEGEDQLRGLRDRAAALGERSAPSGIHGGVPAGSDLKALEEVQEASKKKNKKKKEKKEEDKVVSGKRPTKAVQKEYQDLYSGTGLDQKDRVRRRVLRKARRLAARKRAKSESSTNTESSSSESSQEVDPLEGEAVFMEDTKTRSIAERYPGALSMEGLGAMRRSLLTSSGENAQDCQARAIAVLYYRTVLSKRASGAQARELLNLCSAVDCLLRARPAAALDILMQRIKAQESVVLGTSWMIAQQMEIPFSEASTIAARGEVDAARAASYAESKTKWAAQYQGGSSNSKGEGKKGKSKAEKGGSGKDDRGDRKDKGKGQEKK